MKGFLILLLLLIEILYPNFTVLNLLNIFPCHFKSFHDMPSNVTNLSLHNHSCSSMNIHDHPCPFISFHFHPFVPCPSMSIHEYPWQSMLIHILPIGEEHVGFGDKWVSRTCVLGYLWVSGTCGCWVQESVGDIGVSGTFVSGILVFWGLVCLFQVLTY